MAEGKWNCRVEALGEWRGFYRTMEGVSFEHSPEEATLTIVDPSRVPERQVTVVTHVEALATEGGEPVFRGRSPQDRLALFFFSPQGASH